MAKADITAIRDVAGNLADPFTITHREVQYRLDGQGPYMLYIPVSEYSAKRAHELVEQKRKDWEAVVGKTLGT